MAIKAVVLDIGGVLEVLDDTLFPAPWEERLGLGPGGFETAAPDAGTGGEPAIGELTEAEVRAYWQRCLGLDDATADELMSDYWRWYVGTLDQQLFDWFARQRPARSTVILSNSSPGAREREGFWGFEGIADHIVYSHEVGLMKPDPAVFELTAATVGVRPDEIVFLDDVPVNVDAARAAGWHAVFHVGTSRSIAEIEGIIATQGNS